MRHSIQCKDIILLTQYPLVGIVVLSIVLVELFVSDIRAVGTVPHLVTCTSAESLNGSLVGVLGGRGVRVGDGGGQSINGEGSSSSEACIKRNIFDALERTWRQY